MNPKNHSTLIAGSIAVLSLAVALAGYFNTNRLAGVSAASANASATTKSIPHTIMVPAGTKISVRLDQSVSSKSSAGMEFPATVAEPVVVGGQTVIPRGARATGRVVSAKESGRLKGVANLSLALDSVQANGVTHQLETNVYSRQGKNHKKRNWIAIGGTTGAGALIGGLAGGPAGLLIGSGAGAGAGTTYAAVTGKKNFVVPAETRIAFALREPAEFSLSNR